jgi:hypothetical protein
LMLLGPEGAVKYVCAVYFAPNTLISFFPLHVCDYYGKRW